MMILTRPPVHDPLRIVGDLFGFESYHLRNNALRSRRLTTARAVYAWVRRRQGWSLPQIARALSLHHTGVLYGLRRRPLNTVLLEVETVERAIARAVRQALEAHT